MYYFKSWLKLLIISIGFFILNISHVNAADGLKLSWQAPTEFTNGSRLNAKNDLKGYRLYYGASVEAIKDNVVFLEPSSQSIALSLLELSKLNSSLVYFAMTSVLLNGSESELSPSIFYLP